MVSWRDVMDRQMEHEQRLKVAEQNYQLRTNLPSKPTDRWQWRIMNAVGNWLVAVGCRLQTHVDTARQMVSAPQAALDAEPQSARPCP